MTSKYDIGLAHNFNDSALPAKIHTNAHITSNMLIAASGAFKINKKRETEADFIARLTHLNLNNKRLTAIDNLQACLSLKVLYMYENSIRSITGLDSLQGLHTLDLHSNQIERIEGLAALPNLKKLYLDDNHICRIEGLSACTQLEELLLNNQTNNAGVDMSFEVESLEAISSTLRVLQLTHSNVIGVAPLTMLVNLEVVYLSKNPIFNFEDINMMLQACPQLRDLRVSHTPLSEMPKYRESMIVAAEQLVMLDQRDVTDRERTFLKTLHARKQSKPAEQ